MFDGHAFEISKSRRAAERRASEPGPLGVASRPRLRDRVAARWRSRRIDLALADGAPPEAAASLALRARRLTDLTRRRSIAAALRRLVRELDGGGSPSYVRIVPCCGRVAAAEGELGLLADTLADPGPVTARGVAQAWILLTDGTGPLYNPSSHESLRASAVGAAMNLRPWSASSPPNASTA
jgi:hypothetical protein